MIAATVGFDWGFWLQNTALRTFATPQSWQGFKRAIFFLLIIDSIILPMIMAEDHSFRLMDQGLVVRSNKSK